MSKLGITQCIYLTYCRVANNLFRTHLLILYFFSKLIYLIDTPYLKIPSPCTLLQSMAVFDKALGALAPFASASTPEKFPGAHLKAWIFVQGI